MSVDLVGDSSENEGGFIAFGAKHNGRYTYCFTVDWRVYDGDADGDDLNDPSRILRSMAAHWILTEHEYNSLGQVVQPMTFSVRGPCEPTQRLTSADGLSRRQATWATQLNHFGPRLVV